MKLKITGEYGNRERTVVYTNITPIANQTAVIGTAPNGKRVRITSNTVMSYSGTRAKTVLKDFTEKIEIL